MCMGVGKGFYIDPEGDSNDIISDTISIMVKSLDWTSDQIPDYLLKDLLDKTNWKEVFLDKVFMVELFDALYTV